MLKRIISAVIALPLFLLVLFVAPPWALTVLISLLCAIGCYEMLHETGLCKSRLLCTVCMVLSAAVVPVTLYTEFSGTFALLVTAMVIFILAIFSRGEISSGTIFAAFFSAVFIPNALGSVARIRAMDGGVFYVLLPFMSAWLTDTFAYFSGILLGRHHIAPKISPKKTLEGCIGGTVLCVLVSMLFIPIVRHFWGASIDWRHLALMMFFASVLSQFGDLSMSYIKRAVGIKDYGRIMPGHGGILDRFDSVLFTAPVIEICLFFIGKI